ncbi:MAG: Glu-tRNA(Gln) amidotransferase subunit GatD [Candidatus Helarchaeota archaeon]
MLKNYSKTIQDMLEKLKISPGDKIKIKGATTFEGFLIPQTELGDPDTLVLKLSSGYNIGVKYQKGMTIEHLKDTRQLESFETRPVKHDKRLKTITILHTGGTIASRLDYRTGGVVSAFNPEELLALFPELEDIVNVNARLLMNIWSEDIRKEHYEYIATEIKKEIEKGVDGIILGHGTDTLHYTAAALSFVLQDLPIPVLIVGAQRSSDRGSSDAGANLISAARFIVKTDFAGIAICMHGTSDDELVFINPPCKTRKMHSSRRDAFRPINALPIAEINYLDDEIEFLSTNYLRRDSSRVLRIRTKMEEKVGLVKVHVDFDPEMLKFFIDNGYKGLILEGTGLGHVPGVKDHFSEKNQKILDYIKELCKTAIVVMTTQCLYGRINMNVYDKGRDLQKYGVVSGEDMLPEVALIKLKWLLGNYSQEEARKMISQNLVGEITKEALPESYLY